MLDTAFHLVKFFPEKKNKSPKVLDVGKDRIFSVKFASGGERIFYFRDSTIGNILTVLEAKMFMLGEQEATKNFKCRWPIVVGFLLGAASPIALSNAVVLSPLPVLACTPGVYIPKVKVNTKKMADKNYLQYDTFLMGYEKVARKKMFVNALIGVGSGLVAGVGIWAITR